MFVIQSFFLLLSFSPKFFFCEENQKRKVSIVRNGGIHVSRFVLTLLFEGFCFCCHFYFQSRNQVLFRISGPLQFRTDGVYDQTILGRKLVNPNVRQSLVIVITEQQRNSVRYYRLDQG